MNAVAPQSWSIEVCFEEVEAAVAIADARRARPARWPVVLTALVALGFGCAAFTESPLAERPSVRPYADAVRGHAVAAKGGLARLVTAARTR